MANSRRDAAYHEASHFVRVGAIDCDILTSCRVEENEHGWGGDAGIDVERIPAEKRILVALVGFLGEGRSKTNDYRPPKIEFTENLVQSVMECILSLGGNELAWDVNVPLQGVPDIYGQLSRPDLLSVPPEFRKEQNVRAALKDSVNFLNAVWGPIEIIGGYLLTNDTAEATGFLRYFIRQEVKNNFQVAQ